MADILPSSGSAQTAPPPPDVWNAQVTFFKLLPTRRPVTDTAQFERTVAKDLKVYRDGALIHNNRAAWIKELQSYERRSPDDPQGFSVSRDQYSRLTDGSILIREFTYPIAPTGATIIYHPSYPLRHVTYRFGKGKLVTVEYGAVMESYPVLCRKVAEAKGIPHGC
ncbi:hypothetical protein [Sphingomonas guangdongensis]|uniref:hypothetical protein n=1 Tax=Sphingomonas guangdongensis TaxID=1141890 RepID=UPI0011819AE5|nr:hypothetical protein [Sphingomonas guangdongensis]